MSAGEKMREMVAAARTQRQSAAYLAEKYHGLKNSMPQTLAIMDSGPGYSLQLEIRALAIALRTVEERYEALAYALLQLLDAEETLRHKMRERADNEARFTFS